MRVWGFEYQADSRAKRRKHSMTAFEPRKEVLEITYFEILWKSSPKSRKCSISYRSEPTMKTFGFTARYFPLPHPISAPTAPSGNSFRKRSTIGQGYKSRHQSLKSGSSICGDAHLVSCRREMRGYLLIDGVHVFGLISLPLGF